MSVRIWRPRQRSQPEGLAHRLGRQWASEPPDGGHDDAWRRGYEPSRLRALDKGYSRRGSVTDSGAPGARCAGAAPAWVAARSARLRGGAGVLLLKNHAGPGQPAGAPRPSARPAPPGCAWPGVAPAPYRAPAPPACPRRCRAGCIEAPPERVMGRRRHDEQPQFVRKPPDGGAREEKPGGQSLAPRITRPPHSE